MSIWFGLVWFYSISTIVGYLRLNPLHTYILNMICKHFVDNVFKQAKAHSLAYNKRVPSIAVYH